ncbi:MAG: LysM peptidoglycan-binding domain-containing protein, partial [Phycisphaerae bacterium]
PPAPPAPGGAPAAPAEAAVRTHVMKQGETLQGLAIKYYGAAKYTSLILAANKQLGDPRRIPVGAKITIPPAPPAGSEAPKASAGASSRPAAELRTAAAEPRRQPPNTKPYQVKKGDTWRKLAAMYYGSEAEAPQLFELNKRSPNETMHTLRAGETIYVPLTTSQASPPARTLMGTAPKP